MQRLRRCVFLRHVKKCANYRAFNVYVLIFPWGCCIWICVMKNVIWGLGKQLTSDYFCSFLNCGSESSMNHFIVNTSKQINKCESKKSRNNKHFEIHLLLNQMFKSHRLSNFVWWLIDMNEQISDSFAGFALLIDFHYDCLVLENLSLIFFRSNEWEMFMCTVHCTHKTRKTIKKVIRSTLYNLFAQHLNCNSFLSSSLISFHRKYINWLQSDRDRRSFVKI